MTNTNTTWKRTTTTAVVAILIAARLIIACAATEPGNGRPRAARQQATIEETRR